MYIGQILLYTIIDEKYFYCIYIMINKK